ncbi:MAG: TIGR00730 family Rossman fold protein [Candidatus Binataceae bacterium]
MRTIKRVGVFCGSSPGAEPEYLDSAGRLAQALVNRRIGLVYGGASVGLMGHLARAVLKHGGEVIGVIRGFLVEREVAFKDLPGLRIVGSMHERKSLVAELSDGFIALPGGLGTIEEFFEVLTWAQLGRHEKPCGLLNVRGYFSPLIEFVDHAVAQRFVKPEHRSMMLIDDDPFSLLEMFARYQAPKIGKWIDRSEDAVTGVTPK